MPGRSRPHLDAQLAREPDVGIAAARTASACSAHRAGATYSAPNRTAPVRVPGDGVGQGLAQDLALRIAQRRDSGDDVEDLAELAAQLRPSA